MKGNIMNYKTIIMCAVIGASMESAYGMNNDDNQTIAEQVRQQNLAIARLLSKVDALEVIIAEQGRKLNGVHNAQQTMKQDVDILGRKTAHINSNNNDDKDGPHQSNTDHGWSYKASE
jgi:outer membrane murein-binding lipoprotein Lpp